MSCRCVRLLFEMQAFVFDVVKSPIRHFRSPEIVLTMSLLLVVLHVDCYVHYSSNLWFGAPNFIWSIIHIIDINEPALLKQEF